MMARTGNAFGKDSNMGGIASGGVFAPDSAVIGVIGRPANIVPVVSKVRRINLLNNLGNATSQN